MPLIPVFKNTTREQLTSDYELEFSDAEWVSIVFPFSQIKECEHNLPDIQLDEDEEIEFETNRYDASYYDVLNDKTISVYMYFDESSEKLLAVDNTVQDPDLNLQYDYAETPLRDMIDSFNQQK